MNPSRPPALVGDSQLWMNRLCLAAAFLALLTVFHCFAFPLLPERRIVIPASAIEPLNEGHSPIYVFPFSDAEPNRPQNHDSRVSLFENGIQLILQTTATKGTFPIKSGNWAHKPGFLFFSSFDNSDPRHNGRLYSLSYPAFSSNGLGLMAAIVLVGSVAGLYWRTRTNSIPAPRPAAVGRWTIQLSLISLVFVVGLHCNTGTLAPYANTSVPLTDPAHASLYSVDHEIFRSLYHFVNGADRSTWDHAILLRRILYPALAWPFMRLAGFESGGILAGIFFNVAGLLISLHLFRRQIGERGAIFAGWLLAFYPGAAYWAGLPYVYTLIFPCSLLLLNALFELNRPSPVRQILLISLGMGLAYLAYDLVFFFLPASILVLAWQRRWTHVIWSIAVQLLPSLIWNIILRFGFDQTGANSNTGIFSVVANAYLHPGDLAHWWDLASQATIVGWHVWFGANFLFLPILFLGIVALNAVTSRIKLAPPEVGLLLAGLALFLFTNLAPPYENQWNMRGAWISRLYQPVFPVLISFAARWWQMLPPLRPGYHLALVAGIIGICLGNALVVFGPILHNPGRVSEYAFYSFYTHTDCVFLNSYENNLDHYGRRPRVYWPSQLPQPNLSP